jgi:plastocyanin
VETILSFNGVNVSVNPDTGKLVVEGNTDAVIEQSDTSVTIKGENGSEAGAGIAAAQAVASVNVSDLLASHPDLVLPSVPSGYALLPQAEAAGDSLTFTWQDASGHQVIYQRSAASSQGETPASSERQAANSISSGSGIMSINGESVPVLTYTWEADGYIHDLTITDTAMSEADQQAMLP